MRAKECRKAATGNSHTTRAGTEYLRKEQVWESSPVPGAKGEMFIVCVQTQKNIMFLREMRKQPTNLGLAGS